MQPPICDPLSSRRGFLAAGTASALFGFPHLLRAADPPQNLEKRVEEGVARGLEWLRGAQVGDGRWSAGSGAYPVAMTGMAGMCFLMEGSNLREGKYSDQIQKAVDWLIARQQHTGLIGDPRDPREGMNYMHAQGFATLFLARVYGEAEDSGQQKKIERCLTKAVEFICKAQTHRKHKLPEGKEVDIGGWGYVSATDSNSFDEGSVTVTQLQALRAARNAAIPVPKETINRALAYLEACTTPAGGVIYSYGLAGGQAQKGNERIPLTAAAIACSFNAGQYTGELPKKWIKFCKEKIPLAKTHMAHQEYQNYYYAQAVYVLGEDRYGSLFPDANRKDWLTWSRYREAMFPHFLDQQDKTGAWNTGYIGPVYATAVYLTILQLERAVLPIYQR